jgi:solute carrier family 35 protein C2
LFKLEKWRHSIIAIVTCIAFGLFLFTFRSTDFVFGGFVLVMLASFFAGLRWTLAQTVTQKHELGLSNPIDMIYHIQPGMILILLPLAVYVEGLSVITTNKFFRVEDIEIVFDNCYWILVGALIAFFLEASEFLVVTFTSSLTLSISGIFKEVCIIYLAVIWNHNKLNTMNTLGLIICLFGISIHVFIKAKDKAESFKGMSIV